MSDYIEIPTPVIPYGPEGVPPHTVTAQGLREAADKVDKPYPLGGSNYCAAVRKLLLDAADAVEEAGRTDASTEPPGPPISAWSPMPYEMEWGS